MKIIKNLFLLVFLLCLTGCTDYNNSKKLSIEMIYCNWYNCSKLPSMEDPFLELYDGSYSFRIDRSNNVIFNTIDKDELKGTLEYEKKKNSIDISIRFENNEIANGSLNINDNEPFLHFFYKNVYYCFSNNKSITKEEFETYRLNFNTFLRDSFINDTYPTIEEVEANPLYTQYTNFMQIDPCCNGPKTYIGVNKVTISSNLENGEFCAIYNTGEIKNINTYDIENIVLVKEDGTFERLDKIQSGLCFLTDNNSLFYFENIKTNIINIQDAYESNKISIKQLQEIATIFNEHKGENKNIDNSPLLLIKERRLSQLKKRHEEATIDDIILKIYWNHEAKYIITITDTFTDFPDVIEELCIDGITISYSGPKPMFVEINNNDELVNK